MELKHLKEHIEAFLEEGPKKYLPNLSIDCVIFAYHQAKLKVLIQPLGEEAHFVLPGGFIGKEEDIDAAAIRILQDRTGYDGIFLQQFQSFGSAERAFGVEISQLCEKLDISLEKAAWMRKRFVTIGYYALIRLEEAQPKPGLFSQALYWTDVNELPQLAMDHEEIILSARKLLADDLVRQPVAERLLPSNFTIPELQGLYETILDRPIDRGNFRKKVLKANILEKLNKQKKGVAHRAAQLYKFHPAHYQKSLLEDVKMGF